MFRRSDLDYRTRETKLFAALQRRFYWDVFKLFVAIGYPIGRVYGYLNAADVGAIALLGPWLSSPPFDTVGAGVLLGFFQWKNMREFRSEILPKAESVAYKHGRRRSLLK